MITKLEIDGFKSFEKFEIVLQPVVVIAGANASGKSNLFDAITLLSEIAKNDLLTSFSKQRGEPLELFTQYGNNEYSNRMKFGIEVFLDAKVKDDFGEEVALAHRRLRYELEISRRKDEDSGIDKLYVISESLKPILKGDDQWISRYNKGRNLESLRKSNQYKAYISTETNEKGNVIYIRQDGTRGGRPTSAKEAERTVLSTIVKADFPHIFALREEMISWKLLQLNPVEMRRPSSMIGSKMLGIDGQNLPSLLNRVEKEEKGTLKQISRIINRILGNIVSIRVDEDHARQQYVLFATNKDGREFSSRVLSEGTLRLILLSGLSFDGKFKGVLCFEEPENGLHPFRIRAILDLIYTIATDFSQYDNESSLKQVLINTHSTVVVKEFFQADNANSIFYYSQFVQRIDTQLKRSYFVSKLVPVSKSGQLTFPFSASELSLSHNEVIEYLKSDDGEKDTIEALSKHSV